VLTGTYLIDRLFGTGVFFGAWVYFLNIFVESKGIFLDWFLDFLNVSN